MLDAAPACPLRLELDELLEVVAEPVHAAAVEPGPEGRFAHGDATHARHPLVIVGDAGNHVDVGVDEVHGVSGCLVA